MTTIMQIRADVKTAERFKAIWERMKISENDPKYPQGKVLDSALDFLEIDLNNKLEDAR